MPEQQGWTFGSVGSVATSATNGVGVLDTSDMASTQAGWSQVVSPGLERAKGFTLLFSIQLEAETHNNVSRAGFSLILISNDERGIELGFWIDTIFAQSDSPLFTHAEEAIFPMHSRLTAFALTVLGTKYVLHADGLPVLSGPIRDYTAFGGLISPYRVPNFLFLGDDTTSASGTVRLKRVALIRPMKLTSRAPSEISWIGVAGESYTVQASSNLTTWTEFGTATATSDTFAFTNSLHQPAQFLRVVYP